MSLSARHRAPVRRGPLAAVLGLVLVVAVAALAAVLPERLVGGDVAPVPYAAGAAPPRVEPPREPVARTLLSAWDARRADAWARGSEAGLRALYVPGAPAGEQDVAMLREWRARGLTVDRLRTEVLDLTVLAWRSEEVRLRVTDRVAYASATGAGERHVLPADRPSTYSIVLRRHGGVWLVASVRNG